MPLDERMLEQNDPNMDTIISLQHSITATLTYIMGRGSLSKLFEIQAYLSARASEMASVGAGGVSHGPQAPWDEALWEKYAQRGMPDVLAQQMAEIERQQKLTRAMQDQAKCTPAQYRQER